MVLLPEEAEMTLAELRQVATRQQHQIEAQQQLLLVKEQRLKFLKQQEARHHYMSELKVDPAHLQSLREKVESQELKLRHLRALHGQVEQQKTTNGNLGAELESIQALFSEKEEELNLAVNKVEELTRQLDEIRINKTRKSATLPLAYEELENLRQELRYQNQTTDNQNSFIAQQREIISQRQKDVAHLDIKIAELTQRLHRKQRLNDRLVFTQAHRSSHLRNLSSPNANNIYPNSNIATVEPIQRELLEPEQSRDDLSAKLVGSHQKDFSEFSVKKNDPKYQTLPYNTKFSLKGKQNANENAEDNSYVDSGSDSALSANGSSIDNGLKSSSSMGNFVPRPFSSSHSSKSHIPILKSSPDHLDQNRNLTKPETKLPQLMQEDIDAEIDKKFDTIDAAPTRQPRNFPVVSKPKPKMHSDGSSNGILIADPMKLREKMFASTAVVKPVVPPKPSFPAKPVPPPRQTPVKDQNGEKNDVVNMAISILQSKSTAKDKKDLSNYKERLLYYQCVSRCCLPNQSSQSDLKVTTYFPKLSASVEGKNSGNIHETGKWKLSSVQLPIKPKPLTIRKTPGLEPPKLKIQQQTSSNYGAYRKPQEGNVSTSNHKSNSGTNLSSSQKELLPKHVMDLNVAAFPKTSTPSEMNSEISLDGDQEPFDSLESDEQDAKNAVLDDKGVRLMENNREDDSSSSPCDSLECFPIHDSDETPESHRSVGDRILNHTSLPYHRVKGNLKTEGTVRSPRRVSFDPLALLLDAALEGELELVKKTANEVPNPSASNDEGITALHNAICAGHFDVVTFLVEFGCDVNAQDSDGWTPLHCAASCNNLPMVKFLVERGACIFATTLSDHETAAEKCEEEEEGFDGCSEYLYGLQENMGIMNDRTVYAVYDYQGHNADELTFRDGDKITVLRNGDDQESEWWWSRVSDEEGYLPRNLLGLYPRISLKKD